MDLLTHRPSADAGPLLPADMCERLMAHNDQIPLSPLVSSVTSPNVDGDSVFSSESLTRFHSRSPPNISVLEYLRRIAKYTNVEVRVCCRDLRKP